MLRNLFIRVCVRILTLCADCISDCYSVQCIMQLTTTNTPQLQEGSHLPQPHNCIKNIIYSRKNCVIDPIANTINCSNDRIERANVSSRSDGIETTPKWRKGPCDTLWFRSAASDIWKEMSICNYVSCTLYHI